MAPIFRDLLVFLATPPVHCVMARPSMIVQNAPILTFCLARPAFVAQTPSLTLQTYALSATTRAVPAMAVQQMIASRAILPGIEFYLQMLVPVIQPTVTLGFLIASLVAALKDTLSTHRPTSATRFAVTVLYSVPNAMMAILFREMGVQQHVRLRQTILVMAGVQPPPQSVRTTSR